ncbi:M15 family metallopeptidase [Microbacterium lushaniae]|uniref:M15 family metallopeptidase n=1 Tax=Microbacterium lushaniae TaxID=2614639 RepID=UPI00177EB2B6|nr:M15 family metallopeptidase [Microbacterium lushaniae]
MTAPDPHALTRRALREAAERAEHARVTAPAQHARRRRPGMRVIVALAGALVLATGAAAATGAALTAPDLAEPSARPSAPARETVQALIQPIPAEGLPTPVMSPGTTGGGTTGGRTTGGGTLCEDPALTAALAAGDDAAAIGAAGGPELFRSAVAAGTAPCIRLDDPARVWVVINKQRPYVPIDAEPSPLRPPDGVRTLADTALREDAAGALSALVRAAADAGAGEIAVESAYRSYATQRGTYGGHAADRGVAGADLVSARPGFSEHQSGLTADVVPCDGSCATIDDLAGSAQGQWIAEHAWEHGWIVRYVEGRTDVTGYMPEPWHLRYIGPDLARTYHEGGWTTLEEFFGLPPAPGYTE